ncbi:hypothetical protein HGM15179_015465 [Zosterops borbonicus]|uniref:Rna-directed dna polymerase from mobile element jockey-like n=1 Tax=Zosterops borbonicus TaxID=364589 RepID=A0A8K1LF39_9PASS|nr:hypothetical protein HGM15179_015465 [Zosterops borbonicus]
MKVGLSTFNVIQKDLNGLERWAEKNQLKFRKGKCRILPLGTNNPLHQDRLGAELLESSSAEKDLGILVDTKLSMNQQCPCGQEANGTWGALGRAFQQGKGGDPAPLLSSGEASPGVQCPVLGSSGRNRHGVGPVKGDKDD